MATGNHYTRRWFDRANRHRSDNHNNNHYNWAKCLFAITIALDFALTAPAGAEGEVYSTAQPQAAATSNNTNQSIQLNQTGSSSRQQFGGGLSCNGPTVNVSPFYLGNDTISDPSYQRANNWGIQFGVSIPLDGSITEMCKQMVRRKIEKERLDYELVRALKCAELLNMGYTIRPDHPLSVACEHVVSIEAWRLTHQGHPSAPPVQLESSSMQSSSQASGPSPADGTSMLQQSTQPTQLQQSSQPQTSPQEQVQGN